MMLGIIIASVISAIVFLLIAVLTPWWYFAVFTCIAVIVFGITYGLYNRQKHPEEYKKGNNDNPNARLTANGSKAGTIIALIVLVLNVIAGAALFIADMLFISG